MKHADFEIGTDFLMGPDQRWRCTDVGARTIVAIELNPELEESWFRGPPYAVDEITLNEIDIAIACRTTDEVWITAQGENDSSAHPGFPQNILEEILGAGNLEESEIYPRKALLRADRVSGSGEVFSPYAAKRNGEGWNILVYELFTGVLGEMPDDEFVRLRPCTEADLRARRDATARFATESAEGT